MANKHYNRWSLLLYKRRLFIVASIWFLLVVCTFCKPFKEAEAAATSINEMTPSLELRVDQQARARVFCNGLKIIPSIGEFFEFFELSLTSGRKRIFKGPWGGSFRENPYGMYLLTGNDLSSGAEYKVIFKQVDARTIELHLSFKTPSITSGIEFDIAKFSSDIFKGGDFVPTPTSMFDTKDIPLEPRSLAKRMLLTDKNRILVRGLLCDIEITDLADNNSIYAADGRNVPWDKYKSIMFGAKALNLTPGSRHDFKYLIRSLPPTRTEVGDISQVISNVISEVTTGRIFNIPPKSELKKSGSYKLTGRDAIFGLSSGTAEIILAKGIEQITGMHFALQTSKISQSERGIVIERVSQANMPDIPPDGFEIMVSRNKVIVRAADERGCLYGVYALLERIVQKDGKWGIGCVTIKDWPDLPVRGGCLELLSPAIRNVGIMKRYLDAYSRARSNLVIFQHHPKYLRSWARNSDDGGWTKEQIAEIAEYARWLHMDVWGGVGSGFFQRDFPEMDIHEGTNFYNPFKEKNYQYLFSLYDKILKTYKPSTLLISHDEIQGLSVYAAESGKSTADILASDIWNIHDWLKKRKVGTAMWGDMLLEHATWEAKVGSANSRNPVFRSGATHLALQQLPKDVFIFDWHYRVKKSYDSIKHFRDNGFNVAGASWHDPQAAQSLAGSVKRFGGQGIIATDWGFWRTMSPSATTLYAPICGWLLQSQPGDNQSDVSALAEIVRDPIYSDMKLEQFPESLREVANKSSYAISGSANKGLFNIGTLLDLRAFQSGEQILGGVIFDIAPDSNGLKNNVVVVANSSDVHDSLPKEVSLFNGSTAVHQIAFLHTAFIEEPITRVRKLGFYRVEYENGKFETIEILDNWNITDVRSSEGLRKNDWTFLRSPDLLIGAKRVWQGSSASGIPLNLQLFLWNNPHPNEKIRRIKIIVGDDPKGTRIALLGMTFLK